MKTTTLIIITLLAVTVNIPNAPAQTSKYSEKDLKRYAERITVTTTLEKYTERGYTINDIIKDAAFIRYKQYEESNIAKEKRALEQKKDAPKGLSIPIITLGLEKKEIIRQETEKYAQEYHKQLANIFRFYANIPIRDIAKDAKRIESQIPKNAINDINIEIDSDAAVILSLEFIKDFCQREVRKRR